MDRRTFLTWVGVGTLASSLPAVIVACSTQESEPQTSTPSPENEFVEVGNVEELDIRGFILNKDAAAQPVLVFRNPNTSELIAVTSRCTHQGCDVDLDTEAQLLVCPCHGSKFTFDGSVFSKPATKPLASYEVKQQGNSIVVKVIPIS
ncbi:MAG: Rieske (2Fe-2S) protein [Xenococcaceae cyanobacterium MO_167.B27]|nr:Rieske (2Fe-2S) protein [Xenococcaceae cyanobacterium MO_167.B27]